MSADGKYYVVNRDNLTQHIQMQLSWKEKFFSEFFLSFLKSRLADVFLELRTPKYVVK